MSIDWFRDLVICIFGLGGTIALIFIAILAYSVYRQLRPVMASLRKTARTMEDLSDCVEEEIARPLAKVIAFVQGARQAVGLVNRFTKRREDD